MARLLEASQSSLSSGWVSAFVPLVPKEIPRITLERTVQGWFNPELGSVTGYTHLQDAIEQQKYYVNNQRYPHTEALFIVVELILPTSLVHEDETGCVRIDLDKVFHSIKSLRVHVTAKLIAGYLFGEDDDSQPGDVPFDGSIHETIEIALGPQAFTT